MATTKAASAPRDDLSETIKTGRSLILLQLVSRLVTFTLNQTLIRLAPPEVFGTAAIQFDLLTSTILFLSREGIRNALLRPSVGDVKTARDRLASVPFFLGIPISGALATLYLYLSKDATIAQPDFHLSLALYVVSSLLELSIEPLYIRALTATPARLNVRVGAEGGMAVIKAVVTCAWLVKLPQRPLLGFALGQAAGTLWLVGRYVFGLGTDGIACFPGGTDAYTAEMRSLAVANTRQSFIKHFLTEADRIAVSRIAPLKDQGGYAVAMNYGSLIARIMFQPLEETLLLHFSSHPGAQSGQLLVFILHLSSHLFFLLPAFLPPLFPPVAPLLLPRRYLLSSAPRILQTYLTWYIPLMSLNGILEAFHTATATPKEVALQARWMFGSSAVFIGALLFTQTPRGERLAQRYFAATAVAGGQEQLLIAISCLSMLIRIVYAMLHARKRVGRFELRRLIPRSATTVMIMISGVIIRRVYMARDWRSGLEAWARLMGTGVFLGLNTLILMYFVERGTFRELRAALKEKSA